MCVLWGKDLSRSKATRDYGWCLSEYLWFNWPPPFCCWCDVWKYKQWVKQPPVGVVSRHDQAGAQSPLAAVWMSVSFEEFSVLLWIDAAALPSHPHLQLPQTAFHPHRLYRAPPPHRTSQLQAEPLWPEIPSPPFHPSQLTWCRTHAPQSTPPPSGQSLNHWPQLPLHSQKTPGTLWVWLRARVLQGQHSRRPHPSLT